MVASRPSRAVRHEGALLRSIASYAREIKPRLSPGAFAPARSRLLWLPVHVAAVVISTVAIERAWVPWFVVPLFSLLIGASFAGLTFLGHEALHGAVVRGRLARRLVGWIGFLPFVISPRLWIAWHNRIHHGHTNEADVDPDAYPTLKEYRKSRAVRVATDFAAPGRERYAGVLSLVIGFSSQSAQQLFGARRRGFLSARQHRLAILETALGIACWTGVAVLVGPMGFLLCFVLPLLVANTIVMAFILTNHSLSPHTPKNDALRNSLSVTAPRWVEWLTLRFGFHVEHHVFPAMSSRHAPEVRDLLRSRWPDDYQSMPLSRALLTLHRTARVYKSESILIDPLTGREWPALGPSSS
jgi:fatty acid desaturase